jgi:hypothetical protein
MRKTMALYAHVAFKYRYLSTLVLSENPKEKFLCKKTTNVTDFAKEICNQKVIIHKKKSNFIWLPRSKSVRVCIVLFLKASVNLFDKNLERFLSWS